MPRSLLRLFPCGLLMLALSPGASAFNDLTRLQNLVYDTPHLDNTRATDKVIYDYIYTHIDSEEPVHDNVTLTIHHERDEGRRDVTVDFLSGEHRLPLPAFDDYRGNPVIIAMLEHLAQSMGRDTGGGALYFRNRIRDSLAERDTHIRDGVEEKTDTPYAYKAYSEFVIKPFVGDPYLAERPEYTQAQITFRFSQSVPGQLVSIKLQSGPSDQPKITRELILGQTP